MKSAVTGNQEKMSFEYYFRENFDKVLRYIIGKGINQHTAEDMAMSAFSTCWEKFGEFDPSRASFTTWVYVIVNNRLKNYYRDKKDFAELDENCKSKADHAEEILEAIQLTFLRKELANALMLLSEKNRKIVVLRYFKKKNSNEIAELVGTTPGNVRVLLKRSLDKMKDYFTKNNIRWE